MGNRYKVLQIIRGTTVDGPGFRTSIYLSGCRHKCPGCHNPTSHNPEEGYEMELNQIMQIVEEEDFNVTITGGDPLYFPEKLKHLVEAIKANRRNLWVYTGYTWEEIISSPLLLDSIRKIDVLVDGPFVEHLRDVDLPFRGSSNQRIIDVKESLSQGRIIFYNPS